VTVNASALMKSIGSCEGKVPDTGIPQGGKRRGFKIGLFFKTERINDLILISSFLNI